MRRSILVAAFLLLGLLAGLALQPDDGTAVQRGDAGAHSVVAGANHAKPLPRLVTPADLLPTLAVVVGLVLLVASLCAAELDARCARGQWFRRLSLRSLALAQRGPPTFA